mmetsp:Transcript_17532/g.49310  ORF Transcript_17532/g.49310 Transcript_17532/m.49310 type:complete len:236 (+) Transcript_17532:169-876(+)
MIGEEEEHPVLSDRGETWREEVEEEEAEESWGWDSGYATEGGSSGEGEARTSSLVWEAGEVGAGRVGHKEGDGGVEGAAETPVPLDLQLSHWSWRTNVIAAGLTLGMAVSPRRQLPASVVRWAVAGSLGYTLGGSLIHWVSDPAHRTEEDVRIGMGGCLAGAISGVLIVQGVLLGRQSGLAKKALSSQHLVLSTMGLGVVVSNAITSSRIALAMYRQEQGQRGVEDTGRVAKPFE